MTSLTKSIINQSFFEKVTLYWMSVRVFLVYNQPKFFGEGVVSFSDSLNGEQFEW